jgi:hypothetical protein
MRWLESSFRPHKLSECPFEFRAKISRLISMVSSYKDFLAQAVFTTSTSDCCPKIDPYRKSAKVYTSAAISASATFSVTVL